MKHAEIQPAKTVMNLLILNLFSFGLNNNFWMVNLCISPVSLRFAKSHMFCFLIPPSPLLITLTNRNIKSSIKCAVWKS